MARYSALTLFFLLFLSACKEAPKAAKSSPPTQLEVLDPSFVLKSRGGKAQMKKDILYLASDELAGRDTGTEGEALAADYISKRLSALGVAPAGTEGYYQAFDFNASPIVDESNSLVINGVQLQAKTDYYPLNFSGNGAVSGTLVDCGYGIEAPELGQNDYASNPSLNGQVALISVSSPDGIHPHSKYLAHNDLKKRAQLAHDKGAAAVLFFKDDRTVQDPSSMLTENSQVLDFPILFLRITPAKNKEVALDFKIIREQKVGKNVVGFLDKGAEHTIIVGAHYDHLGHGIKGSTLQVSQPCSKSPKMSTFLT